jgi:hypothetical protein
MNGGKKGCPKEHLQAEENTEKASLFEQWVRGTLEYPG